MTDKSDEKKLFEIHRALEKIEKTFPPHTFSAVVRIEYDGEAWGGYIHPFVCTDTAMPHIDRIMCIRNFRTNTLKELIDQMYTLAMFQEKASKTWRK